MWLSRLNLHVAKSELIDYVWPDPDHSPEDEYRTIVTHVYQLRKRLENVGLFIRTRWGYGFGLFEPEIAATMPAVMCNNPAGRPRKAVLVPPHRIAA